MVANCWSIGIDDVISESSLVDEGEISLGFLMYTGGFRQFAFFLLRQKKVNKCNLQASCALSDLRTSNEAHICSVDVRVRNNVLDKKWKNARNRRYNNGMGAGEQGAMLVFSSPRNVRRVTIES